MYNINIINDLEKLKQYYRTSDMINLCLYFPEICPITELVIIEDEEDYIKNYDYIKSLDYMRADSLKGRGVIEGIETSGDKKEFLSLIKKIKEKDQHGVLVLFNVSTPFTERYERTGGIAVGVSIGNGVYIDSVGKGFDGREVSKGIASHERFYIPWYDLRKCNINNFRDYRIYKVDNDTYKETRLERVEYLKSINLDEKVFDKYIPKEYEELPDSVWLSVIKYILIKLEKMDYELKSAGLEEFVISGNVEGPYYSPWQMYDKNRFILKKKK